MDLTLKFKGLTLLQLVKLVETLDGAEFEYEEVIPQEPVQNPWFNPERHPWDKDLIGIPYHFRFDKDDINGYLNGDWSIPCLFDGVDPTSTMGLACGCPKCSPQSMTGVPE
jgi:hypothetical protein